MLKLITVKLVVAIKIKTVTKQTIVVGFIILLFILYSKFLLG